MDAEILIDTYRDIIVEAVLQSLLIAFKIVYIDGTEPGIHDPVFPHTCGAIFEQFDAVVDPLRAGRYDFYDPVRRSAAAILIQFSFIADYGDIRLHIVLVIRI